MLSLFKRKKIKEELHLETPERGTEETAFEKREDMEHEQRFE